MAELGADGSNGLRVLVVDDNVDIADALAALLDLQGCQVRVAHHGEAGLEEALDFEPEVIFLDIGLPGMDGYEVARQLRSHSLGDHTTLVALTGYGQASDRQKAVEAGFDHHLVKPARLDQIRQILDQA
ncbi:response regulator [Persicimonas caeni]|nr:response regulator [Persicimonas caeni]